MALSEVKKILVRAATDPDFRKKLFNQPDSIFSRYELTKEEKEVLKEIDEEKLSESMRITKKKDLIYSNDIRI